MSKMILIDSAVALAAGETRRIKAPTGAASRMSFLLDIQSVTGSLDVTLAWRGATTGAGGSVDVSDASGVISAAGLTFFTVATAFLNISTNSSIAIPFPNEAVLTIVTGPVTYSIYMIASD